MTATIGPEAPSLPLADTAGPPAGDRRTRGPSFRLVVTVVTLLTALVIGYPLIRMIIEIFVGAEGGAPQAFRDVAELPGITTTILNTLVVVGVSTVLALVIAAVFAWLNERTDARLGFIAEVLPLVPLLVPPLAGAIGWLFLLSPRAGMVNVLLRDVFASFGITIEDGPIDLYSRGGLVFLYTLLLVPYCYLPVAAALSRLDPALEEASRVSGAGPMRTLRTVTLPAVRPALAAGALTAVVIGLATFSVPVIIGTGAGIDILSVRIYRLLTLEFPPQTATAVALSTVILLVVFGLSVIQRRILRGGAFATIGGRGAREGIVKLGRSKWVARGGMLTFVALASVLPFLGLVYVSLRGFWSPTLEFTGLTIDNYLEVLVERGKTVDALVNSVTLGVVGAVIGILIATVMAIYVAGRGGPGFRLVDNLARLPGTLSHLVIGVAFLAAFAVAPFRLGGTATLLLMAYVVMYLPQAYLTAGAAYGQVSPELREASTISGAGEGRTFARVTFPLMATALVGGAATLFVLMAGEVTASALLSGTQTPVIGFTVLDLYEAGTFPQVAALGVVMTVVTAAVTIALLWSGKARSRTGG